LFYQKSLSTIKVNSLISHFQLIYILSIIPKHTFKSQNCRTTAVWFGVGDILQGGLFDS